MKVTKTELKRIIKEELEAALNEIEPPSMMTSLARSAGAALGVGGVREKRAIEGLMGSVIGYYDELVGYVITDRNEVTGNHTRPGTQRRIAEVQKWYEELQQAVSKAGGIEKMPENFRSALNWIGNAVGDIPVNLKNIEGHGAKNFRANNDQLMRAEKAIGTSAMYERRTRAQRRK